MDTFAWIEYLDGSPRGTKVRDIVENSQHTIITSPISIAEIVSKYHRKKRDVSRALTELEHMSSIPPADNNIARLAGEIQAEQRKTQKEFPLADAFIGATAKVRHAKLSLATSISGTSKKQ